MCDFCNRKKNKKEYNKTILNLRGASLNVNDIVLQERKEIKCK